METSFSQPHYQAPAARPSQTTWRSFLPERLLARTQETALVVAERFRDPDFVHTTAELAMRQSLYPSSWPPIGLGAGDLGVALMYAYVDCCFPGQGWDAMTHQYLSLAAAGTQQMNIISPNLFSGTSGLAFTLSLAGKGGKHYQKTLVHLHQRLCNQVFGRVWRRPESDGGVASQDFDVIVGAAGILAYLVSVEQPDEQIQSAIERLVTYLTWLGEPDQPEGRERWYIPSALLPNEQHRERTPQGNFNCGLAHGIPGPLAALALTALAGYHFPGLHESIAYLANWIIAHQVKDARRHISWPENVPLEVASSSQDWQKLPATRPAWCYGAPGVARSLWLAGCALSDLRLRQVAVEAIEGALCSPVSPRSLPSAHLCHGVAGLLQICLRFAHECDSRLVQAQIPVQVEQILDAFHPEFVVGFRNVDMEQQIDEPAWLTGAAGIAMTLLAASTPALPRWDRALAIA